MLAEGSLSDMGVHLRAFLDVSMHSREMGRGFTDGHDSQ